MKKHLQKTVFMLAIMLTTTTGAWAQLNWSGTQNLSGGQVINENITLTGNVTINVASGEATINGAISGNYSITKTGSTLILTSPNNSYTGATNINQGCFRLNNAGNLTATSNVAVAAGAWLDIYPNVTLTFTRTISGSGDFFKGNSGKLILTANSANYTGKTTVLANGGILQIGNGTSGSLNNTSNVVLDNANSTLRFEPGSNMYFDKVISGAGKVENKGTGTKMLFYTANNTYTGTTTIEEGGVLAIGNNTTSGAVVGNIINNGYCFFNRSNEYIYSGVISGPGETSKTGSGKTILTGINTYTGETRVNVGTLQIGNGTSGSIANTSNVTIASDATLRFEPGGEMIFNKVISGAGKVEHKGMYSKALRLTANNTYTGTTTIEANSDFWIGNNTTTGAVVGNISAADNAWVYFNRSNEYTYSGVISGMGDIWKSGSGKTIFTGANTYTGMTTINAGTLQIGNGTSGSINNTSNVVLENANCTLRFEPGSTQMFFDKVISGPGKVEYNGNPGVMLFFSANNTYTGTTTIEAGAFYIGNYGTTGAVAGNIINNGKLYFNRSNEYTYSGVISGTGDVRQTSEGKTILTGTNTYTGQTFVNSDRILQIGNGTSGSIANTSGVYIFTGATLRFEPGSEMTFSKVISGEGNVEKGATGTLTLSGANTATGTFTHSQGTVNLSGTWAGNYNKASGTALTVTGNPTIGGTLTLAGGNINMNLTGSNPSKISVTGALSASGTNTINITDIGTADNYTLISAASGVTTAPFTTTGATGTLSATSTTLTFTPSPTVQIYHEDDKATLRAFLRQPSATAGQINALKLGLTISDTTNWQTDDAWVAKVSEIYWNGATPKRLIEISWIEKNIAGNLNLSGCTALTMLGCYYNQLTSLDVSSITMLVWLGCALNQLTSLDVSNNTALEMLSCVGNQLTSLDVSHNTALTSLNCWNNQLTSLDVSHNPLLTSLDCSNNPLTSLDVSHNTALEMLNCDGNQLTSLDVSHNTALTSLNCWNNQLTSLDVSHNTALEELGCDVNPLTSLDVSHNTALEELRCGGNQLTSLDVSNNTALTSLGCSENQLTSLDVSHNTALTSLWCSGNQLTSLDVSYNTALKQFGCYDNNLTTLNVTKLPLEFLTCQSNYLPNKSAVIGFTGTWDNINFFFDPQKDPTEIIPVTEITNLVTKAVVDIPIQLVGTVTPANATFRAIDWSIIDAGTTNAVISGADNNIFTASATGTAILKATIQNGITIGTPYEKEFSITVTAVGIEELTMDNGQLTIYPNPTRGELRVTSYELQVTSIEVFDVYGRTVSTHYSLLTTHYSMDISHLPAGIYFLKIETEKGPVVKKVVKQ